MRFSRPTTTSRLRRPMSASTRTTVCPSAASAAPRFAVVVVLPTPPLPEVMTMARPMTVDSLDAGGEIAWQFAQVTFDDDSAAGAVRDLRLERRLVAVARARDLATDAQLLRLEPQRQDEADVLPDAGVCGAAQAPEHDDVAGRAHFGARIDVAKHDHVPGVIENDAGPHRPDD